MIQLPVLVLQLLRLLGFTAVHPTILRLPAVVSLLRDPVLSAQLRRCQSCLALLQDRDDLLFAVSRAFHCGSPLLGLGRTHILDGPVFGGWVSSIRVPTPLIAGFNQWPDGHHC